MQNPLREALGVGRFCYVVELVASRLHREARILAVASGLASVPGVVGGSVTSYAGGAPGRDPIRVAAAAKARGLTPNVHVTCVSQHRQALRKTLEDLHALGIENVFAMTGDYPAAPPGQDRRAAEFDLDSVQLVALAAELRQAGMPFHIAVAVSPFKYAEADCAYQYLKLEKKIAAGADLAITQVGFDAGKFRELKRYLDERGLRTSLLGNVYVLTQRAAERMARGLPPGCWVAPELLEQVRREAGAKDGGRAARLERAARLVAVLRGLGYAGAYLGGTDHAERIAWIIRRAEELAARWEELADEFRYAPGDGFYLYEGGGRRARARRGAVPAALDALGRFLPVRRETRLRRALRAVLRWVAARPRLAWGLERAEMAIKGPVFGCQACGNCVLGDLEYVCPQTCPKQMRNGPCGGTHLGRCEVEDKPCIWTAVYERAKAAGRLETLKVYVPPPHRQLQGTSSWINYFLELDSRPRAGTPPAPKGNPP